MGKFYGMLAFGTASLLLLSSKAEQCGSQAGGASCSGGRCCSQFEGCGDTADYCGRSIPTRSLQSAGGVGSIITRSLFDEMLKHRNDSACPARNFFTYDAFIIAANAFTGFGTAGDLDTRKREIAAFMAQTSHETTGGWASAPDGPYAWGYCYKEEQGNPGEYCVQSAQWPCARGKRYYGRGPIQISYNYNYGPAGRAIGVDVLSNPDVVATDPIVSFMTALWFWMTPQSPKPSCHDVITGRWSPSASDQAAGLAAGYGMTTNIISGGSECSQGSDSRAADRVGFYRRYCDILGVSPGANLGCYNQGLRPSPAQVAWRVSLLTS